MQEPGLWVVDELRQAITVQRHTVKFVVQHDFSQEQVRGPSNPHGEHARDVFRILELPTQVIDT